jgi:dihydrofolate reductase
MASRTSSRREGERDRLPVHRHRLRAWLAGGHLVQQRIRYGCTHGSTAGGRAVMVHGAGAAQALLRAGLLDEMEIHLVPVLLGGGRRLFDSLGPGHVELELVRQLEGRDVTHLRYQVRR